MATIASRIDQRRHSDEFPDGELDDVVNFARRLYSLIKSAM